MRSARLKGASSCTAADGSPILADIVGTVQYSFAIRAE
jgi:hypothetical protein